MIKKKKQQQKKTKNDCYIYKQIARSNKQVGKATTLKKRKIPKIRICYSPEP